jgi:thiol:disulfide interchange protein
LTLKSEPKIQLKGAFRADPAPKVHQGEFDVPSEEHEGSVTWTVPVTLPANIDPGKFTVELEAKGQACSETCLQFREKVPVKLVGFKANPGSTPATSATSVGKPGPYKPRFTHASVNVLAPASPVQPGSTIELSVVATPDTRYHIYAYDEFDRGDAGQSKPALIGISLPEGWKRSAVAADSKPVLHGQDLYHEKKVTWKLPITVPKNAVSGEYPVRGYLGLQTCDDNACDAPAGVEFRLMLVVGTGASERAGKAEFLDAPYSKAADWAKRNSQGDFTLEPSTSGGSTSPANAVAGGTATVPGESGSAAEGAAGKIAKFETQPLDKSEDSATLTLSGAVMLAFVGGFLLNFMPCVLPVIGLKVLSFVNQSQGSRRQVFLLNLSYSLGIILVFLALATFSVTLGLGWGQQFNSPAFTIVLTCLVFAFALSMLGVWEIPLPGFLGTGSAVRLSEREGLSGAFGKGVLTTLLATPCTGPFMGSALTWSVSQPPATTFLTFFSLGAGMASPYIVIGIFPVLVRFLPRPGDWMITFKSVMGFMMLGTVAFIFSFLNKDYVGATFGLLVGLWAGCWWIGRTSITAEIEQKLVAWVSGSLITAAVGFLSFWLLVPHRFWQDYRYETFEESLSSGNIVLVDFTADWCAVCRVNEATALNTKATTALFKKHGVVAFRADYGKDEELVGMLMDALGHPSRQLPMYAVFPGPGKPVIKFEGPITAGTMARAIEKALAMRDGGTTQFKTSAEGSGKDEQQQVVARD